MKTLAVVFLVALLWFGWYKVNEFGPISKQLESLPPAAAEELIIDELTRLIEWQEWRSEWDAFWGSDERKITRTRLAYDLRYTSSSHFEMLLRKIDDPELDNEVKKMWINMAQCVYDEDYFRLIDKVLASELSQGDKVALIQALLSPPADWGTRFADKYQSEQHRRMLERIASDPQVGDALAGEIERISSGLAKVAVDYLRTKSPRPDFRICLKHKDVVPGTCRLY